MAECGSCHDYHKAIKRTRAAKERSEEEYEHVWNNQLASIQRDEQWHRRKRHGDAV